MRTPAFITFTGVDDASLVDGMRALASRYPVEWGILIDSNRQGLPLFPDASQIDQLRQAPLRLSAHICGTWAADIAESRDPGIDLAGFSRIQINYGRSGADSRVAGAVSRYAASQGVRGVLQCNADFPLQETGVDWLFDVSFGEGVRPSSFPVLRSDHPFCGYSGGIGPENVAELLSQRIEVEDDYPFWIDMESGVRSAGAFDLRKCEAVCQAVYGPGGRL